MTNSFSFINTGSEPVQVIYTFTDPDTGETISRQESLRAKGVASSQSAQARFGLKKKLRLRNAEIVRANGAKFSVMSKHDAFGNVEDILKKSIIVDIETLGRESGSVITQMGAYNVGTGKGTMYVFQPSVIEQTEFKDDRGFKNRSSKRVAIDPKATFKELKYAEYNTRVKTKGKMPLDESLSLIRSDPAVAETVEKELLNEDYFQGRYFASEKNLRAKLTKKYGVDKITDPETLARQTALMEKEVSDLRPIRNFMQALGSTMSEADVDLLMRQTRGDEVKLSSIFKSFELKTGVDMKNFLTQDMPDLLRGKVTWIANAAFESTQFGAQIDAEAFEAFRAFNSYRQSQGLAQIESKEFFPKFAYGGYGEELGQINASRIQSNLEPVLTRNPMYGVTEGISTYDSKPFYVTGAKFSEARAAAFESGDFSNLYKTFLETTRPGDVRDIIDLVRMQQSTLIKQGLMTSTDKPASLSMEIQARVYGVTEALRLGKDSQAAYKELFQKELHIGIGDVRLSEFPVLRESLDQLEALRLVEEGGEAGRSLERQAARGEGAYFRAQMYGEVMDVLNTPFTDKQGVQIDSLQDVLFKKRIADSLHDLAISDKYELREYTPGRGTVTQIKDVGGITVQQDVPINRSKKVSSQNVDDLFEAVLKMEDYPAARKESIVKEMKTRFKPLIQESGLVSEDLALKASFEKESRILSESFGDQIKAIEARFQEHAPEIIDKTKERVRAQSMASGGSRRLGRNVKNQGRRILSSGVNSSAVNTPSRNFISKKLSKYSSGISKFKKGYLGVAAAMLGASFIPKEEKRNLLLGSKEEFIQKRAKSSGVSEEDYITALKDRYNAMDGMPEKGMAGLLRKMYTDFGSPYQSPRYSMSVLDDHNMRRERERYMAAQFGARHFSAEGDIGFFLKRFVDSAFKKEMGFSPRPLPVITSGRSIDAEKYNSLQGRNLTEYIVPENSNITVEDADTITVRDLNRSRPSLAGITGDPGEMRIRLAGIDAPETAHAGRAAQPYAEQAKRIAAEMISKAKDVRIIAQKGNSTYGRQVAMVYADGVNVNLELLKRGAAAYLPYKSKKAPPIYNQQAFEEAQERAYQSKRGMWREPFFQAYKMITDVSNQTTTFNTLVNMRKVAKNGHLMSMRSMMDQAQEMGLDARSELELADLGKAIGEAEKPFSPDNGKNSWSDMDLQMYGGINNSILSILDKQKHEVGNLMRTRGSLTSKDKVKTSRLTRNNVEMTKNILAEKEYKEENLARHKIEKNMQDLRIKRLKKMEQMQHIALGNQFNSPIKHYRM
jgi:endonuclease YncB( thermonuclease family)